MNKYFIHRLVQKNAVSFPNRTAVVFKDKGLTYQQLNLYSSQIAAVLTQFDIVNKPVALFLKPSIEYICCIIAINKAGGIFVPLELSYPPARIKEMLEYTLPPIIITDNQELSSTNKILSSVNLLENSLVKLLTVEINNDILGMFSVSEKSKTEIKTSEVDRNQSAHREDPNDSAYLMFTSGSTGVPKAIEGRHKSLSHFIHWEISEFQLDELVRTCLLAPLNFDVSLRDIFVPLVSGGAVCIPNEGLKFEISNLINWINKEEVSLLHCVPSTFKLLIDEFRQSPELVCLMHSVQHIALAGEALYYRDVLDWKAIDGLQHIKLTNLYGPSETTLAKLFYHIPDQVAEKNNLEIVPLGKPITNTSVLILNQNELCQVGEVGEIFIKTPFRSKGYFRNEKLTSELFIQNPLHNDFEDIVYKTGDLGRLLTDETILFEGRKDGYVKINGNRVEPLEVEKVLSKFEAIKNAIVFAKEDENYSKSLVCYYSSSDPVKTSEVANFLQKYLPEYMIPSTYIHVAVFPLNNNGKIDKKKLGAIENEMPTEKLEVIMNHNEKKLGKIWEDVLKVEGIGRDSSFFELGGSSLKVIQIISRIYNEFKIVLKLPEVLKNPTIKELTKIIESKQLTHYINIPLTPQKENYNLSSSQMRIWILQHFRNQTGVYNIHKSLEITGKLDIQKLTNSVLMVIKRHEILRTAFIKVDSFPKQKIISIDDIDFSIQISPAEGMTMSSHLVRVQDYMKNYVFDLDNPPLIKIVVIPIEEDKWHVLAVGHHIVLDARSFDILFSEILKNYDMVKESNKYSPTPLKLQYKDYAEWEKRSTSKAHFENMKLHWDKVLEKELTVINLPYDYQRPAVKTYNGDLLNFSIEKEVLDQVKKISTDFKITNYTVLLTLFKILLYKYSGIEDIIVGTPVSNRNHKDLNDLIGVFVNTLVLRTEIDKNCNFFEQLVKVNEIVNEALGNREYPFEKLISNIESNQDSSRSPIFDIFFSYLQRDLSHKQLEDKTNLYIAGRNKNITLAKYDLSFTITELKNTLNVSIEYNTDLFKKETIEGMAIHFQRIAHKMLFNTEINISEISLLNSKEINELSSNGFRVNDYQDSSNVVELFEKQVNETPNNIAVVVGNTSYTYENLNKKANSLGHYLSDKVNRGDNIGILMDRSEYMIISILAILKVGAVYVPLDPIYPKKRMEVIIQDAEIEMILMNAKYSDSVLVKNSLWVEYENEWNNCNQENLAFNLGKEEPIYILYTSGSTGLPKGVINRHISILNLSLWLKEECYDKFLSPGKTLLNAELVFDASVQQLFAPLISGAAIHIISNELRKQPEKFIDYLYQERITLFDATPSFLSILLSEIKDNHSISTLKYILIGGEPLSRKITNFCFNLFPESRLINVYGVTEAGVDSAYSLLDFDADPSLITQQIPNTRLYILDKDMNPIPNNCIGELYISGDGVAKGYLNNPELTNERFLPSPFVQGETLFNTKDLCKRLSDGSIKILGRSDDQIKIRGYRIQMSEINNVLLSHPAIDNAYVINWSDNKKENYLIAYYVCREQLDNNELRYFLENMLPMYMIPNLFIPVDEIPINTSGKKNLELLVSPEMFIGNAEDKQYPTTDLEQNIAKIWESILGKENIGMEDDFFSLGGHSINAIQILSRLNKELNIEIELSSIFLNPTVFSLSKHIQKNGEFTYET